MPARMKARDRPKGAGITPHSTEKRHEPFWHLGALRKTRYDKKTCHGIALANPHIQSVEVFGRSCIPDCARRVRDALFDPGVELASAIVDKLGEMMRDGASHRSTTGMATRPGGVVGLWLRGLLATSCQFVLAA